MKVLHVSKYCNPDDKYANKNTLGLISELNIRGVSSVVVTTSINENYKDHNFIRDDVVYYVLDLYWDEVQIPENKISRLSEKKIQLEFSKILDKESPNLVHFHHWMNLICCYELCIEREIPYVYTQYDQTLTCMKSFRVDCNGLLCLEKKSAEDCYRCVYGYSPLKTITRNLLKNRLIPEIFSKFIYSKVAKLYDDVGVKETIEARYIQAESFLRGAKRIIVPNAYSKNLISQYVVDSSVQEIIWPVDQAYYNKEKTKAERKRYTSFGRVSIEKGLETILDAAEELKKRGDFEKVFQIYGFKFDGSEYEKKIIDAVYRRKLNEHVVLKKWAGIEEILDNTDVFLFMSNCMDNTPIALLNVVNSGLPVIINDVPTMTSIFPNNFRNIVQFNDAESLVNLVTGEQSLDVCFLKIQSQRDYAKKIIQVYEAIQ